MQLMMMSVWLLFLLRIGQRIKPREIISKRMWKSDTTVNETYRLKNESNLKFCLVLYGLVIAMAFLVNPFLFFYYEEKEDEERTTAKVCRRNE